MLNLGCDAGDCQRIGGKLPRRSHLPSIQEFQMKNRHLLVPAMIASLCLAACSKAPTDTTTPATAAAPDAAAAPADAGTAPKAEQDTGFDITRLPLSDAPVGDFPFFALPQGYSNERRSTTSKDFARFPFWVDGQAVWVEGRFYGTPVVPVEGKTMSEYEVKKNFEAMVTQLGGSKVSEDKIPREAIDSWGDEITQGFNAGLGDVWNVPAATYVVRRADGNIWLHLVTNSSQAWYVVGLEKAFEQSAALLPASELKSQIDASGKVALQVNFATDKTDILPDSMPQIDQVVQLLEQDPALRLAINGHTDNTGDAARNKVLSEGRAKAVVDALVARGIDAGRLVAAGFGDSQPVADNGTEQGKAMNRRVELVKR